MKTCKNKILVLIILLLFVGQVVATPLLDCATSPMDSHSMSMMDMSSHDMSYMLMSHSSDMSELDQEMDCCGSDCECPSGMCLSVALYLSPSTEINFNNNSNQIDIASQKVNKQALSYIYRPPIFC